MDFYHLFIFHRLQIIPAWMPHLFSGETLIDRVVIWDFDERPFSGMVKAKTKLHMSKQEAKEKKMVRRVVFLAQSSSNSMPSWPCMRAQLGPTLCNPNMDCRLSGSSVHGIFHARMLEWVSMSYSRGSSWSRDQVCISCISRWSLPLCHLVFLKA